MRVYCSCGTYSIQTEEGLETKLTVGAETNQIEVIIIRLPVDQNQIRFDVAVAMIRPFTGKRMIKIAMGQWCIGREVINDFHQGGIEFLTVPS